MRRRLQLVIRREDHKHDSLGALFVGAARDAADWRARLSRYLGPGTIIRAVVNERDRLRVSAEVQDFPTESANLAASAQRLAGRGLTRAALGHYLEALRLSPLNSEALRAVAALHYRRGEVAEAERCLVRAREASGDDPELLRLLGMIALERGRRPAALGYLQEALALNPEDEATRAALASVEGGRRRAGAKFT